MSNQPDAKLLPAQDSTTQRDTTNHTFSGIHTRDSSVLVIKIRASDRGKTLNNILNCYFIKFLISVPPPPLAAISTVNISGCC
jgi:hypothetical protein